MATVPFKILNKTYSCYVLSIKCLFNFILLYTNSCMLCMTSDASYSYKANIILIINSSRWELADKIPALRCSLVSRAIKNNLISLTSFYCKEESIEILHILSDILTLLKIPAVDEMQSYSPPVEVILNLTNGTINYFFICCNKSSK